MIEKMFCVELTSSSVTTICNSGICAYSQLF